MAQDVFAIVPGRDDHGADVFSVIVKRTYRIAADRPATRADQDRPLRLIDEYWDQGDPDWSTVQYESELAPYKQWTDVVVIGKAYARGGRPTEEMTAGVQVGTQKKILSIVGDRHCHHREDGPPDFSDPLPFTEMELRYDRAYGGRDDKSLPDIPFIYPRNFMGRGVVLRNVRDAVELLPLPNLEDPQDRLTPERLFIGEPERWHLQPLPQGFGWRQREWYPRSALLGSYPPFLDPGTTTIEERMGLLPRDHVALAKQSRLKPLEAQFANGASFGLSFESLDGREEVTLGGLTPDGLLRFSLPDDPVRIGLDIGAGMRELPVRLHTACIRPDDGELDLIWRGALPFGGYAQLSRVTRMDVEIH
jgi:hypothetical protein